MSNQAKPTSSVSFKLRLDSEDLDKLRIIRQWYRTQLRLKVSVAMLLRTAATKFADEEIKRIEKAKQGALHAKQRKH